MCPIQKGLRPQFLASPNKAPFQLDSRKSGSRSSSQERPFFGPQLIKPRCVWAPDSVRLGTWALTGCCQSSVLPAKPLESWGSERTERRQITACKKEGGHPIWHSPYTVSPVHVQRGGWATPGTVSVQDHITKYIRLSYLLSEIHTPCSFPLCLWPYRYPGCPFCPFPHRPVVPWHGSSHVPP